jgi:hypothetical protein
MRKTWEEKNPFRTWWRRISGQQSEKNGTPDYEWFTKKKVTYSTHYVTIVSFFQENKSFGVLNNLHWSSVNTLLTLRAEHWQCPPLLIMIDYYEGHIYWTLLQAGQALEKERSWFNKVQKQTRIHDAILQYACEGCIWETTGCLTFSIATFSLPPAWNYACEDCMWKTAGCLSFWVLLPFLCHPPEIMHAKTVCGRQLVPFPSVLLPFLCSPAWNYACEGCM